MTRSDYSYLDLTVMPFLRKKVLSGDAAILFDVGFKRVLWANAIGTELFGGRGVIDLLDLALSDNHTLVSQLRKAAIQIDENEPLMRSFRVSRGLKSELLQGELTKVDLPNGEQTILLIFEAVGKAQKLREHSLAMMAVEALDGFADASAIIDEYGLVLASSAGFDSIEIDPTVLETLVSIVSSEDDRLVKRSIETMSGHSVAAGLGRIRDVPARYLIVLADPNAEFDEEDETANELVEPNIAPTPPQENRITLQNVSEDTQSVDEESFEAKFPPWLDAQSEDQNESDISHSDREEETESSDNDLDDHLDPAHNESIDDTAPEIPNAKSNEPSLLDRWYFTDEKAEEDQTGEADETFETQDNQITSVELANEEDSMIASGPDSNLDEPVASQEPPARFAFTIDRNQIVQSVSHELAEAVGENSGDIVGKHWATLSQTRNFDENKEILALLEKADTWSGRSVLWPVENTDMVVPIDLAALPVFDKERNFDGFRGFGIIRADDAIVDPHATGLLFKSEMDLEPLGQPDDFGIDADAQTNINANNEDVIAETFSRPSLWDTNLQSEDAATPEEPLPSQPDRNNVVSLTTKANINRVMPNEEKAQGETQDDHLNKKEKRAFSEISKTLSNEIDEDVDPNTKEKVEPAPLQADNTILENLPFPLIIYRSNETLFTNDALLEKTGYASTDELAKAGGIDALFASNPTLPDNETADVASSGSNLINKDGSSTNVRSRLTTIDWQGEKALCLSFMDLEKETKAKRENSDTSIALDMARVSELENILETAADGILVIDQNGIVESLNTSGEALFNREQSDVVNGSYKKLFATESQKTLEKYLEGLNAPGISGMINQGHEVIGIEASGGLIPIFVTIGKIGQSGRYCCVLRDLTNWKQTEEELVTARRNAETSSDQKSEFLSRISHEIREPLTAIIGFSDVMIEERFGSIENERYREYLKDINRSGIHVLDLVNDLLDISKIEAGKMELSYEAVDLNQLASETVALLQPQANNKRIIIRTSLSRAVPKVVADARSIRQIILNLVSNAINHSPTNSQVIVSTTYEENSEVGLRIRDTGRGMSEIELQRALEPFAQVGNEKSENHGGTGLGLPLTKALVEANRAYFDLESAPGEGTIAHIQFPSQRVLAD